MRNMTTAADTAVGTVQAPTCPRSICTSRAKSWRMIESPTTAMSTLACCRCSSTCRRVY